MEQAAPAAAITAPAAAVAIAAAAIEAARRHKGRKAGKHAPVGVGVDAEEAQVVGRGARLLPHLPRHRLLHRLACSSGRRQVRSVGIVFVVVVGTHTKEVVGRGLGLFLQKEHSVLSLVNTQRRRSSHGAWSSCLALFLQKQKSTHARTHARTNLAEAADGREPAPVLALDEDQARRRPVLGLVVLQDGVDGERGRAEAVVVHAGACGVCVVVWSFGRFFCLDHNSTSLGPPWPAGLIDAFHCLLTDRQTRGRPSIHASRAAASTQTQNCHSQKQDPFCALAPWICHT